MKIQHAKLFCSLAIALATAGCGGSGDSESAAATEAASSADTSDGVASPVQPISSAQMDAFVSNPLLSRVPEELKGGTAQSSSYVSNPLIN